MPLIRLAAPWMLAIGIPIVLLVAWRLRNLPPSHRGLARRAIQACMLSAALSSALALARLELGAEVDRMAVVFLVDRSRSVDGDADPMEPVRAATSHMGVDDLAGVVVFGAEAATEIAPSSSPTIGVQRASVPREGTDIAAAIRRGLADLPAEYVPRLVLISDGRATRGDAYQAASLAAGRGVPIDVLPIERAPSAEIAIERVRLPASADPGQPIELRVITRATHAATARIEVRRDGVPIARSEVEIAQGVDALTLRDVAPEPGVHRYDVLLVPSEPGSDAAVENNEGAALIRVSGGSRAIVLTDRAPEATALVSALEGAGMEVELRTAATAPADLAELATFDLLVLSDLNARGLSGEQMSAILSYVRDLGGGLLMAGARDAFGLGGYAFSPVEEALPATFDLRRRRDRASLAMVIAIDKSGSMSAEAMPGRTKLDLANEAAARSALLLSPFDRIGVAHVDTDVTWTIPMRAVENPEQIARIIRHAQVGGGGILVDLTLEASYDVLRSQPTQLRHLLLFSDGQDSEEMTHARALVASAAREQITTSVVSMGDGPDTPELEALSHIGGGRFYIVENLAELPRIFTQETIEASRSAVVEGAFRAEPLAPSRITDGIDFASAPALAGYATVNPRPRASVLLGAPDDDPLLLEHQHGVGRSAVFATDVGAAFGRPWLSWSGYPALFGQLGRALARSPESRDANVGVTLDDARGHVLVDAIDEQGRTRNHLDLVATVAGPGGRSEQVELRPTAAGRYEADFDADAPGPYLVTVSERDRGLLGSGAVVRSRGDELRGDGTDTERLARIAALSGGELRDSLAREYADRPPPIASYEPLYEELILGAMWLLLISVALRRLVLPTRRRVSTGAIAAEPSPSTAKVPVAPERMRAREAAELPTPDATPSEPAEPAPEGDTAASLAETLLTRKKKRR
ncbi:MAG: VWA domain-containing protein [Sandaracinaceae bacterium]